MKNKNKKVLIEENIEEIKDIIEFNKILEEKLKDSKMYLYPASLIVGIILSKLTYNNINLPLNMLVGISPMLTTIFFETYIDAILIDINAGDYQKIKQLENELKEYSDCYYEQVEEVYTDKPKVLKLK